MRPHAFAKVDRPGDFAGGDVYDHHAIAVGARLADAGVAINRHVRRAAIRRCSHFVSGLAAFGHGGYLLTGIDIDDAEALVAFIGHQQQAPSRSLRQDYSHQTKQHRNYQAQHFSPRRSQYHKRQATVTHGYARFSAAMCRSLPARAPSESGRSRFPGILQENGEWQSSRQTELAIPVRRWPA